ncbi:MAG: formyltetrahydrofolate deformylase [Acidobacteria bacterium]|nr:formyltetrahydrofolate deformylase [Acidobacteriota bacterium]
MASEEAPPGPAPQVLLVDCPDRPGLIHAITGVLLRHRANIVTNDEFVDREVGRFFMRTEFVGVPDAGRVADEVRGALPPPAQVRVGRAGSHRIAVVATTEHHCLGELLLRHAHGELGASIEVVVSNHATLRPLTERFGVPFHHVPHQGVTRAAHEEALLDILERHELDYLVLAKYMRILSAAFVERYRHRIINIHHSFLPAFAGPNPYRQAFERGVKIIGATAHFVTEELDEGPIIAQSVVPVDHSWRPDEMAQAGRDVEKIVLAKALKLVFDERVFLSGNRTIVFD